MLLAWITFFTSFVSGLRSRLRERNMQLRHAMERIEELAIQDELTGAYNRRFIRQSLAQEVERANRAGTPFSICLLDIDHFKQFNDKFGHLIGDAVLRELVIRIKHCVRRLDQLGSLPLYDQVGRFGGEEFLLVLPLTQLEGARLCAERMRGRVSSTPFATDAGELRVTLSAGVAEYIPGQNIEALIMRADQALYRAKESGRNCVMADESTYSKDFEA
jgi:diguanylate cyclase (GGDEF)-like protein